MGNKKKKNMVRCKICDKTFYLAPWRAKRFKNNFCSTKCMGVGRKNKPLSAETRKRIGIANTGKKRTKESREKYRKASLGRKHNIATRKKISQNHADFNGPKHPRWKGGKKILPNGYVLIYSSDHPHRNKCNQVYEHRLIAEKYLKRFLKPEEAIHHIDENRGNNNPKNLYLFNNYREHTSYHAKVKRTELLPIDKSNIV